jgi:hypothetical protein
LKAVGRQRGGFTSLDNRQSEINDQNMTNQQSEIGDRKWLVSPKVWTVAVLGLLAGIVLIIAGRWFSPMVSAQQALTDGRLQEALLGYRAAGRRLAASSIVRRLMPELSDAAVSGELAVLYSLKQYDDVIDKAGATGSPAGRFWAGCALFAKADVDVSDKNRLNWMAQAQQEFRGAIEAAPDDFDARFNYELTAKLIAGMKKDPTIERPKDLQLLVPSSAQAPKKVS